MTCPRGSRLGVCLAIVGLLVGVSVCAANDVQDLARDILAQEQDADGCILKATLAKPFCIQRKDKKNLEDLQADGITSSKANKIKISKGLTHVLKALYDTSKASTKPWSILSLARPQGPHGSVIKGKPKAYGKIGRAVDIGHFAGHQIHIKNPAEALEGIVAVLDALPPGTYNFGLPREKGKLAGGKYAAFLPSIKPQSSPTGGLAGDLRKIQNPEFKKTLTDAFARAKERGAITSFLYPDGTDHLHLTISSDAVPSDGSLA